MISKLPATSSVSVMRRRAVAVVAVVAAVVAVDMGVAVAEEAGTAVGMEAVDEVEAMAAAEAQASQAQATSRLATPGAVVEAGTFFLFLLFFLSFLIVFPDLVEKEKEGERRKAVGFLSRGYVGALVLYNASLLLHATPAPRLFDVVTVYATLALRLVDVFTVTVTTMQYT